MIKIILNKYLLRTSQYDRARDLLQKLKLNIRDAFNLEGDTPGQVSQTVVILGLKDATFVCLFYLLCARLRAHSSVRIHALMVQSIGNAVGTGFTRFTLRSPAGARIFDPAWENLYRSYVNGKVIRSNVINKYFFQDLMKSLKIFYECQRIKDVSGFEIGGIVVGDLIIDSFLRFRPSPKFDKNSWFFLYLIYETIRKIRTVSKVYALEKPKAVITTYTTYIENGVPVRLAMKLGIPVYILASRYQLGKNINTEYQYHSVDGSNFLKEFLSLPNKTKAINEANELLSRRFSGEIDSAISYMRCSSYQNYDPLQVELDGYFCIFLHDFYDSPHCYYDFIFQDYWDWVTQTLDFCIDNSIAVCVKPHPNRSSESDIQLLKSAYPNVPFVDGRHSARQLVDAGVICGLSSGGTVVSELGYFGVPSIGCSRSAHHKFAFLINSSSIENYFQNLITFQGRRFDSHYLMYHSLAYNYMRNCHGSKSLLEFRDTVSSTFNSFRDFDDDSAVKFSEQLFQHEIFENFVCTILKES